MSNIFIEPCLSNEEYVNRFGIKRNIMLDTLGDNDKTLNNNKA